MLIEDQQAMDVMGVALEKQRRDGPPPNQPPSGMTAADARSNAVRVPPSLASLRCSKKMPQTRFESERLHAPLAVPR